MLIYKPRLPTMGELTRYQISVEEGTETGARMQVLRRVLSRGGPGAALVPKRYIRRIQRIRHESVSAVSGTVPHEQCLALPLNDLLKLVESEALLIDTRGMTDPAVLVCEPTLPELEQQSDDAARRWLMANEYHARVDHALDRWVGGRPEKWAPVRTAVGPDGLEEARNVLRSEARLVHADDDHEVLRELVATYRQFREFEPALLPVWFPSINAAALGEAVAGLDVDLSLKTLMGENGFEMAEPWTAAKFRPIGSPESTQIVVAGERVTATDRSGTRTQRLADVQAERGNLVRAILLRQRIARKLKAENAPPTLDPEAAGHLETLCNQLVTVTRGDAKDANDASAAGPDATEWHAALGPLVVRIGDATWPEAAKLLFDLQKATVDFNRPGYRFSLWDGVSSGFKQPMFRELTLQVPARVHGHLRSAMRRAHRIKPTETRLSDEERHRLEHTIEAARQVAEKRLRDAYRPTLIATLGESGFVPINVPEAVALEKLVESLLDRLAEHDYIGFGDLRDAISLSDLKMTDVDTVREFTFGDCLLIADRLLHQRLPGVYRRGPIYMRMLQRLSSLAFGTPPGRLITRYAALPVLGAFMVLAIVAEILHLTGLGAHAPHADTGPDHGADHADHGADHAVADGHEKAQPQTQPAAVDVAPPAPPPADAHAHAELVDPKNPWLLAPLAVFMLALLESARLRTAVWWLLSWIGTALRFVLWTLPIAFFHLKPVRFFMVSRVTRVLIRNIGIPGLVVWFASAPIRAEAHMEDWQFALVLVGIFVATMLLLRVRFVQLIEALVHEQFNVWWERTRRHLLPNLLRWIFEIFRAFIRAFEYLTYTVDESLRFRRGDNRFAMVAKIGTGMLWAIVMYVITLYVTLLVEPQINPIKHFPVVTVSHKVMIPWLVENTEAIVSQSTQLAGTAGGAIAGLTLFLLPGVFGFLAWELTANWRLYGATRPLQLQPVLVGSHGERVSGLLRPGFHSGPVPKIWRRIRRTGLDDFRHGRRVESRHHDVEHLHHVSEAIERFVERDLLGLLRRSPHLTKLRLEIGHVEVTTAMARVPVLRLPDTEVGEDGHAKPESAGHAGQDDEHDRPLFIGVDFVERNGTLVAIVRRGPACDLDHAALDDLRDALVGVLRKSDVDAVAEGSGTVATHDLAEHSLLWADWTARWQKPGAGPHGEPKPIAPSTLALLRPATT